MKDPTFLLLWGAVGLGAAFVLCGYGVAKLRRILRRQRELWADHERLFTYDQHKIAGQASLSQAHQAADEAARRQALLAAAEYFQRALDIHPDAADAPRLREQLDQCRQELAPGHR